MVTLSGDNIFLRALEPEDLAFVHEVENTEDFWEISSTRVPYSRFLIKKYIENSHRDIFEVKQLRLMICNHKKEPLGMIDIFDLDPKDRRAAIGILIAKEENRGKGYAGEVLSLISNYCFVHLGLHQVYANVLADNVASIRLFEQANFKKAGLKKEWVLVNGKFKDEVLYQLINVH